MKKPRPSSEREGKKVKLKDGEAAHFDGTEYKMGPNPDYEEGYAPADTFIVGKNGPTLMADGGPCAVITYYEKRTKLGVVMHIDVVDIFNDRHEELMDAMLRRHPDLPPKSEVHLFVDIESKDPDTQKIKKAKVAWKERMLKALAERGFSGVVEFVEEDGKGVALDTRRGVVRVLNDQGRLIFEKG